MTESIRQGWAPDLSEYVSNQPYILSKRLFAYMVGDKHIQFFKDVTQDYERAHIQTGFVDKVIARSEAIEDWIMSIGLLEAKQFGRTFLFANPELDVFKSMTHSTHVPTFDLTTLKVKL